jgi:hopene-associated glycosyltransferase HpnB
MLIAEGIGAISLLTWIYLLLARGGFWRMETADEPSADQDPPARRIAIIIPARNEADVVASSVQSLLRQDYPGPTHIFLVDDHSSDGTAETARQAALEVDGVDRLSVIRAEPLPSGWSGKLWAISRGLQAAGSFGADYYLFTDADVAHTPDNLASLVERAESGNFDLVSLMVKLHCESLAERLLIPAFVFFFFKLYPPAWVERSDRRTAAAAGGCMLVRPAALARIGGISAIHDQLIDDCALARALKRSGRIWLEPTTKAWSLRRHESWTEIGRMISRTAFTQLRHSVALLFAVCLGMATVYLAPPALIFFGGRVAILGAAAWLLMSFAYWPAVRLYRLSPSWAPFLPAAALFYLGATLMSALDFWRGRGGQWKGRIQDSSLPICPD